MFTLIIWDDRSNKQFQVRSFREANAMHRLATAVGLSCVMTSPGTDLEWLANVPCPGVVQ